MKKTVTSIFALVVSIGFLVAPGFAEPSIPVAKSCAEVERWVEAHRGALPHSLEEFALVPAGYQPGVFNSLTKTQRSELWNAHIDRYVALLPELDASERDILRGMANLFWNGEGYTPSGDGHDALRTDLIVTFQARLLGLAVDDLDAESVEQLSMIPDCNCIVGVSPGCVMDFCIPNQNCGTNGCSGLFQ